MTNQEQFIEVYRQFQEAQRKYVYFLLAIAGAGIALSIKYTRGECISSSQIPLAIAVLLWGGSFMCGCRFLNIQASLLYSNAWFLSVKSKFVPKSMVEQLRLADLNKTFEKTFEKKSAQGEKWGRWQLNLIFVGALFFVAWHVLELCLRTVG